jgi:hypothetical protein
MCNDMHDCGVAAGDAWLKTWVPKILASPAYQAGQLALFITWDENDGSAGNQVPTIVASPYTPAGTTSGTSFNHYSLLRTTEELLGTTNYLGNAASAASMRSAFFSPTLVSTPLPPPVAPPSPPPPPPASACTKTKTSSQTLTGFLGTLVAGDVGCLPAGNYSGDFTLPAIAGTATAPITVQPAAGIPSSGVGCGSCPVTLPAMDTGSDTRHDIRFAGLKFVSSTRPPYGTVQAHSPNLVFDHDYVTNSNQGGDCIIVGYYSATESQYLAPDIKIDHSRLENCGNYDGIGPHGLYLANGARAQVTNNIIHCSAGFGVQIYPNADDSLFDHNIVDGCSLNHFSGVIIGGESLSGLGCQVTDRATVTNNIITNFPGYGFSTSWDCTPAGSGSVVDGNCLFGNANGDHNAVVGYTWGQNNIHADPLYVDRANGNYALQAGSPCAGMGPQ